MNVFQTIWWETFHDIKHPFTVAGQVPVQTSTIVLNLAIGFFGALSRRWRPLAFRPSSSSLSGFVDHITNVKKPISTGFMTRILQDFLPPPSLRTTSVSTGRFTPYGTHGASFPLVVYVTIIVLLLIAVIYIIDKRNLNSSKDKLVF